MQKHLITLLTLFLFTGLLVAQDIDKDKKEEKEKPKSELIGWVVASYLNDFEDDTGPNNGFALKHARLIHKGALNKNVSYHLMGELVGAPVGASDGDTIGVKSADKRPLFMQGWINYNFNKNLSVKVGQFKTPFGLEYYPSFMLWKFINPAFATGAVSRELGRSSGGYFRDAGIELTGKYMFNDEFGFLGKVFYMNGNGINYPQDVDNDKDVVAMGALTMPYNAQIGLSYYTGTFMDLGETAMNFHFQMAHAGFTAQAEYITAAYETAANDIEPAGFYLYGTYKYDKKYEIGARFDSFEGNSAVEGTDKSRITLSTGYYFSKVHRILLNYELHDGNANTANDAVYVQFYAIIK